MEVLIPVGLGELYDKISILEIKLERVRDEQKLALVRTEISALRAIAEKFPVEATLYKELRAVNELIWDNVGEQWEREVRKEFDGAVVELARDTYILNDKRATIKWEINTRSGSTIVEVKSYASHEK